MPLYRKLILLIVLLLIMVAFFGCGSQRNLFAEHHTMPVFYPEDSVSFHRVDSLATYKRDNEQLKKENKKLKLAVILVVGVGWGFTILKVID